MGQCDREKCLVCNPPHVRRRFAIERRRAEVYRRACLQSVTSRKLKFPPLPPIPDEEDCR